MPLRITSGSGGGSGGPETDPVAEADLATHKTDAAAHSALLAAKLDKAANLSDVASAATAKANLSLAKGDVGLGSVDNTADASKPVSTAQQAALDAKAQTLVPTAVKTGAYNAAAGDMVPVDATAGAITVTLPTAPADKTRIAVKKIDSSVYTVTVAAGGSDVFNKAAGSTSLTLTVPNQSMVLQYATSGAIWYVQSADLPLASADARYAGADLSPSSFRKWRKAVANVRTGVSGAKVLVVGDSTSWGKNAGGTNPPAQQSWPARLSGLLNSYFVPSSLGLQSYSNPDPADTRWTLGTGWTVSSNNTAGFAGYCLNGASGAAGALTFAPGYSVDTVDVYYVRNTGFGSSIVTVDGGGTLATIAAAGAASIQKATVSLGSLASNHVISLAGPTGGQFFLIGIDAYDSTTPRVRVSLTGVSASVTGISGQSGAKWLNSSAAYNSNGCITAYAPDLTIMMLGVNDASPGSAGVATYTAAGWATATQSLITLAQASGDVLLVSVVPSSSAGLTSTTAGVALEVAFAQQAKALAATNNCGFVDLNARWVDYATANADGLMADTLHPLRLGHADIAQLIYKSLVAI